MPIPVACQCGQQFAANDQLAGQTVACPSCGRGLQIPALQPSAQTPVQQVAVPQQPVPNPMQTGPQAVQCVSCQMEFAAPAHLAGQVVPCPRCGSPIPIGTGAPTIGDDLFDELPSLEDQQEVLSEEQRKAEKRRRRKEQQERDKRIRKKTMDFFSIAFSLLATIGILSLAIFAVVQLAKYGQLLVSAIAPSEMKFKVVIILRLIGKGLGGALGIIASPLLLARNGMGRPIGIAACILMALGPITIIVGHSFINTGVENLVIYELLAYFLIIGILHAPGVRKYLGD